jgi:hypothetical protein
MHLFLLTRSDPPLPLARLRGRGQLLELRAADLRCTLEEAAAFLNDVMGLHLTTEQVAGSLILRGQLHQARRVAQEGVQPGTGFPPLPMACYAYAYLADVLREWNDLDAALEGVSEGRTTMKLQDNRQ